MNIRGGNVEEKQRAGQLVADRFKEGYNCAEAVLRGFRDELDLGLDDQALKIATGFGGGLGQAGCMCGALTGAIMVLNLLYGRDNRTESRDPAYQNAKNFHDIFTEHFGGSCCRVLNPHGFGTSEQKKNCFKITAQTGEILMSYIEEKKLAVPTE